MTNICDSLVLTWLPTWSSSWSEIQFKFIVRQKTEVEREGQTQDWGAHQRRTNSIPDLSAPDVNIWWGRKFSCVISDVSLAVWWQEWLLCWSCTLQIFVWLTFSPGVERTDRTQILGAPSSVPHSLQWTVDISPVLWVLPAVLFVVSLK